MTRLFTGTLVAIHSTTIVMRVGGKTLTLDAGAGVIEQARLMGAGRIVRFSAELDERTECLSSPRFVVRSSTGLQAVQADL